MVRCWYAAGVFMCRHGALLVCSCAHMVRCWCVHVHTWYAAVVLCAKVLRLGWGGLGWGGVGCVNFRFYMYTWYAAGVLLCTHGTLLVCHVQRSGGKDIPPIRNTMHKVKLHKTAFMANRVKWIRCKLQVIVVFSAKFGEKKSRSDIVKTFNDQLHLKT